MFYCNECAAKYEYPTTFFKSVGRCECCDEKKHCNEMKSSMLPLPKEEGVEVFCNEFEHNDYYSSNGFIFNSETVSPPAKKAEQIRSKLSNCKKELVRLEGEYEKNPKDKWLKYIHNTRGQIEMLRWFLGYQ